MIQSKWDDAIFQGAANSREMWKVIEKHQADYEIVPFSGKLVHVPFIRLKRTVKDKPTIRVVFFHNNRSNARISRDRLNDSLFEGLKEKCDNSIEIIIPEYPLYHNFPDEKLFSTSDKIQCWAIQLGGFLADLPRADFVVFIGHSIGTGFATTTAKWFVGTRKGRLHQLLLLAPISSLKETAFSHVFSGALSTTNMWQRLGLNLLYSEELNYFDLEESLSGRSARAIKNITIIHGSEDQISKQAADLLIDKVDEVIELEGIDHNGVINLINLTQLAETLLAKYAEVRSQSDELRRGKARATENTGDRKSDKDDSAVQSGEDSEQDDD